MRNALRCLLLFATGSFVFGFMPLHAEAIRIATSEMSAPRIDFGVTRLAESLRAAGLETSIGSDGNGARIIVGKQDSDGLRALLVGRSMTSADEPLKPEGFILVTSKSNEIAVIGADDSGVLYGCLELASRVKRANGVPQLDRFSDAPEMKLRGACIGMQKTSILPGRHVYEYPYTPESFPFFYDQEHWREYLDMLVENRMNTLYLWNGQPFASLVKLPDYPYALEVPEEVFERNVRMYRWLAAEADRRGIWLVQMFYNIILSKPFAEHHGLKTQLAAPHPIAADYTRKSIAEFVRQYPNVGLLVCLGEALQDLNGQVEWCTEVILPGVKDGMKAAGLKEEPPVVIRAHATNPKVVMPAALKVYKNLYTMAKFNGESLTTWEPRGVWQETHQMLAGLGTTHVVNVHILANLEPFRYGAVRFIKKSVEASRDRLGAGGLHLYPLTYWNWPDAPDVTSTALKQIDRDWIWFEAWARYAWKADREESADEDYWVDRIATQFGDKEAARHVLAAYNAAGECAPRLLRRFGITEGNRQTLALGMTLEQLTDPEKYRPYPELWKSQSPPGERLQEYADREWRKEPHAGETPPQIVDEVLAYSAEAVTNIDAAMPLARENLPELERVRNDVYCIRAMSLNYAAKVNAALAVLRYRHSGELDDLVKAEAFLAESLEHYRTLVRLTSSTYRFANSMQTSQRRIPVSGGNQGQPANYHWSQVLPTYEQELVEMKSRVAEAKANGGKLHTREKLSLQPANFELMGSGAETYTVQTGSRVFTDRPAEIQSLAPELNELTGIRFSMSASVKGTLPRLMFRVAEPVRVLVGYVQSAAPEWRRSPELETDATAGDRGGVEPLIVGAAVVDGLPPINVHAVSFGAGQHELELRGSGAFVVLGVVRQ
jgi:hypothetical protein